MDLFFIQNVTLFLHNKNHYEYHKMLLCEVWWNQYAFMLEYFHLRELSPDKTLPRAHSFFSYATLKIRTNEKCGLLS